MDNNNPNTPPPPSRPSYANASRPSNNPPPLPPKPPNVQQQQQHGHSHPIPKPVNPPLIPGLLDPVQGASFYSAPAPKSHAPPPPRAAPAPRPSYSQALHPSSSSSADLMQHDDLGPSRPAVSPPLQPSAHQRGRDASTFRTAASPPMSRESGHALIQPHAPTLPPTLDPRMAKPRTSSIHDRNRDHHTSPPYEQDAYTALNERGRSRATATFEESNTRGAITSVSLDRVASSSSFTANDWDGTTPTPSPRIGALQLERSASMQYPILPSPLGYDMWTTPKIVEPSGPTNGGFGGVWGDHSVLDFKVSDTPVGGKYPPMDSFVPKPPRSEPSSPEQTRQASVAPTADDNDNGAIAAASPAASSTTATDMDLDEEQQVANALLPNLDSTEPATPTAESTTERDSPSPATTTRPPRGTQTISRAELDSAQPHPHLYFCRSTYSWALFAPLVNGPELDSTVPDPLMWKNLTDIRRPLHLVEPSLPPPIPPANSSALSRDGFRALEQVAAGASTEALNSKTFILGTKTGQRVAYSSELLYPAVIPKPVMEELQKFRNAEPLPNQSPHQAFVASGNLIWKAIDAVLFQGETRGISTTGNGFRKAMAWDSIAHDIFLGILGFREELSDRGPTLNPPPVDLSTEIGRANRQRLLRCWLELGLWLEDEFRRHPEFKDGPRKIAKGDTRIQLQPARPRLVNALGGDRLPRVTLSDGWQIQGAVGEHAITDEKLARAYHELGVIPQLADEVILGAFQQLIKDYGYRGPVLLESLECISKHRATEKLTMAVVTERSLGHYTTTDIDQAYDLLGFAPDKGRTTDELELTAALNARNEDTVTYTLPQRKEMRDALSLIARSRQSDFLEAIVKTLPDLEPTKQAMSLDRAKRLLDVREMGDAIDPEMLIMVYGFRVEDSPAEKQQLTEALAVIGKSIDSDSIARHVAKENGGIEWPSGPSVVTDLPVGLTNIANTCYLNSLLQYFFTVRDLRQTILEFHPEQSTGGELNRVGGRLVTQAEVERSKKFVSLLQNLFNQLIHSPVASVTPETELAYLALVPSKDEAVIKKQNLSHNADDADSDIIIIDPPVPAAAAATAEGSKSPSVLGKRSNNHLDTVTSPTDLDVDRMAIDSQAGEPAPSDDLSSNAVDSTAPMSASSEDRTVKRGRSVDEASRDELVPVEAPDGVVSILPSSEVQTTPSAPSAPPALPPRPNKPIDIVDLTSNESDLEKQVSNYMAFGRQNDVTECMDNVMFQIECALNPTANTDAAETPAASLLKKTFYGKMRQQLVFEDSSVEEPVRTKEELFSSLLVDVAEEGRNVYDGLDTVFDNSLVDIEGKQARREVSLVEIPSLLQIQLQRVQYDREQQKAYKSNAHMSFGDTISMDRYLAVDPNDTEGLLRKDRAAERKVALDKCRARLDELTKPKGTNLGELLVDTYRHLSGQAGDLADVLSSELAEDTLAEAADVNNEIAALNRDIGSIRDEIEQIWADEKAATYELVSVFIHRGTASSGHYYIYQRDHKQPKRWLKYNDSIITEVDPAEHVFAETTGDTNAYFLVYCRRDHLEAIESIAREIV